MGGLPGQIISELGELGKQVGSEVVKAPKDIAGKALESLGASSGKKQGQQQQTTPQAGEAKGEQTAWEHIDGVKDEKAKKAMAREALAQLAARGKPKEPSVWERIQMEEKQKKEAAAKQAATASMAQVPQMTSKPQRGNLYGVKAKRQGSELGKNVRQD